VVAVEEAAVADGNIFNFQNRYLAYDI
jgi:hypothetical protein